MSQTPDLSRIVNLIMENPELIKQISALANTSATDSENDVAEAQDERPSVNEAVAEPHPRSSRQELLSAMKPYLSDSRRSAIDSMITISEVLYMMKKK